MNLVEFEIVGLGANRKEGSVGVKRIGKDGVPQIPRRITLDWLTHPSAWLNGAASGSDAAKLSKTLL